MRLLQLMPIAVALLCAGTACERAAEGENRDAMDGGLDVAEVGAEDLTPGLDLGPEPGDTGPTAGRLPPPDPRLLWRTPVGGPVAQDLVLGIDGRILVVATRRNLPWPEASEDGVLIALDPDGQVAWQHDLGAGLYGCTPLVMPDGSILAGTMRSIEVLSADGASLRSIPVDRACTHEHPAALGPDGTVYWRLEGASGQPQIWAIEPATGSIRWQAVVPQGYLWDPPPVVDAAGRVLVTTSASLFALGQDGFALWTADLAFPPIAAPAVGADGALLVLLDRGRVVRLDASDGHVLGIRTIPQADELWFSRAAVLVADADRATVVTERRLVRFDGKQVVDTIDSRAWIATAALLSDGRVLVADQNKDIRVVGGRDAEVFRTGQPCPVAPAMAAAGRLYAGCADGVYAFDSGLPLLADGWPRPGHDAHGRGLAGAQPSVPPAPAVSPSPPGPPDRMRCLSGCGAEAEVQDVGCGLAGCECPVPLVPAVTVDCEMSPCRLPQPWIHCAVGLKDDGAGGIECVREFHEPTCGVSWACGMETPVATTPPICPPDPPWCSSDYQCQPGQVCIDSACVASPCGQRIGCPCDPCVDPEWYWEGCPEAWCDGTEWRCPAPVCPPGADCDACTGNNLCAASQDCRVLTARCAMCVELSPECAARVPGTVRLEPSAGAELPIGRAGAVRVTLASTTGEPMCQEMAATVWVDDPSVAEPEARSKVRDQGTLLVTGKAAGMTLLHVRLAAGPEGTIPITVLPAGCGDGLKSDDEACDVALPAGWLDACPIDCGPAPSCGLVNPRGVGCDRSCVLEPVTDTAPGDGCCAAVGDPDCPATCGNGVVELGETCDGDCPVACDDGDPCTDDVLLGGPCSARCVGMPRPPVGGDGCCPQGAWHDRDSDCPWACGNGIQEPGEDCDGDCEHRCDSGDGCLRDFAAGEGCTCAHEPAGALPGPWDGCCPAGASPATDPDCPACSGSGCIAWKQSSGDSAGGFGRAPGGTNVAVFGSSLRSFNDDGSTRWEAVAAAGELAIGDQGQVYVLRLLTVPVDGDPTWEVRRYEPDGQSIEARTFTGTEVRGLSLGYDGTVYVSGTTLRAYDEHLRPRWTSTQPAMLCPLRVRSDGALFAAGDDGVLRALRDAGTGVEVRWTLPGMGIAGCSMILGDHGRIYVLAGGLRAVRDAGDRGEVLWTLDRVWLPPLAIDADGWVLAGSGPVLASVRPDGTLAWKVVLGNRDPGTPGIEALVVGALDRVYAGTTDTLHVLTTRGRELATVTVPWSDAWTGSELGILSSGGMLVGRVGRTVAGIRTVSPGLVDSPWPTTHGDAQHANRGGTP